MILITASARPVEGARDRLTAAALEISEATRVDPGCLRYTFAASLEDDSILSFELWESREALQGHMGHAHTKKFLADLDGVLAGPPVMQEIEL
jgi:quinol monooxygenase YgiN